jgi:prepilin-type N-terminal cleavage/methylation domain-containing protein
MIRRWAQEEATRRGFTIVELLIVIVVLGILAAIVIVAYTGLTNRAKLSAQRSETSQWKKTSETYKVENNIECPAQYAFVYRNDILGTPDFCVMKYEARNVGGVATSQPSGTPWVNLTQGAAVSAASSLGGGHHLVSELEWMAIAADVLSVKYNWSSGTVGQGFIYSGHNDNAPNNALAATSDDADGYNGTGNSETNGANQKRVLILKSGDVIWDFAGNVWEWTSNTINGAQPGASGYATRQYTSVSSWGNLPAASRPSGLASQPQLSDIGSWNSTQGIGQVLSNSSETTTRMYLRGGDWDAVDGAGVLSLDLSNASSWTGQYFGFRVAK